MDRGKSRRQLVRPPVLRTPTVIPQGPRLYKLPKDKGYRSQFNEPPPGFVGAHTSLTEWHVYLAMSKVFGVPLNPHEPPWLGAPGTWWYQSEFMGGRKMAGGAVVDVVVAGGVKSESQVGFRIVTERHHLYADSDTQASDLLQLWRLSEYMRVVDIFDMDFLQDPTGQACIVLIKDALAGRIEPNPNTQGTTQRVTKLITNVR